MNRYNIINDTIYLIGRFTKHTIPLFYKSIKNDLKKEINFIDGSMLIEIDNAGVALLNEVLATKKLDQNALINFNQDIEKLIKTLTNTESIVNIPIQNNIFQIIGDSFYHFWLRTYQLIILTSDIFFWAINGLLDKKGHKKGSFTLQSLHIGFNAIPIVALLSFIIGLILSLQTGIQLKQLGADQFLPNLLTLALVSELAPLITAVIVAGRSGSAIASEIATMKVTEELDALRMMALNPIRYVVIPKFHAITIVMPLLVLISILVGVFGGLIIAVLMLDMSATAFINASINSVPIRTFVITMFKSIVFAWQIVIIGSHYGFLVQGGAEGVGKATTKSVVAAIFGVIIMDAIFSFLYIV